MTPYTTRMGTNSKRAWRWQPAPGVYSTAYLFCQLHGIKERFSEFMNEQRQLRLL